MGIVFNSRYDIVDAVDVDLDSDAVDIDLNSDEWDDGQPTHHEECQDLYGGDDYIEQWEDDSWD